MEIKDVEKICQDILNEMQGKVKTATHLKIKATINELLVRLYQNEKQT